MPELPEVETMVRGIRPHVAGRRIRELTACPCACRPLTLRPQLSQMADRCRGRTVAAVRRVARRVLLELDSGAAFVIAEVPRRPVVAARARESLMPGAQPLAPCAGRTAESNLNFLPNRSRRCFHRSRLRTVARVFRKAARRANCSSFWAKNG